ncbi:hypothetical protein, partial [Actinomadura roseirufa]|uniref:hypothetical protein n=1 Tax=Actinomadura roseirufa TaxID=2094049 RepID=UPI001041B1D5
MSESGAAAPRWARGAFLAAACALLSLAGHVLGGGRICCLPPLPAILVTSGAIGALCVGLAGQMLSFRRILAVLGWAQLAFHLAFGLGGPSFGHHPAGAAMPQGATGIAMGPSMIAGHAAAAVAAAALLAGAERAVWWVCGAVFAVALARSVPRPARAHR